MKNRGVVLFFLFGMAMCLLAPYSYAAPSALNQAVARNLAESLRADLQIADQQAELSPLANSTYVLLDALEEGLQKRDIETMRYAVDQYADDMRYFQAEAIDIRCLLPLVPSLSGSISSMQGIVSSGGTPLCIFINLSSVISDLLSTASGYQICVINGDSDPATDNATLVQQQKAYRTFGFATSVMNLLFCKRPWTSSDITILLLEFLDLMQTTT
ncbi:MAG: hypothetical protein JW832_14925 [Deltaproteobacteria bacterium]|nr:hypothetical protein [Deltaproteobacteria bacterium]